VCVYVLVAIMRKELNIERSMADLLQILSVTLLEKELLSPRFFQETGHDAIAQSSNQLSLFDI